MVWAVLPTVTAGCLSAFLLGLPAYRAFVREEEAWMQAGFALYFFFVPIVVLLVCVSIAAGFLCLACQEVRYASPAISVATSGGILVLGLVLTFFFGLLA